MSQYPNLLSLFRLGGLNLPNRAALSPMTRTSAEPSGLANERMVRYYTRFAKGGFGLIITEGLYPDSAHSQGYLDQPGIADSAQMESWRPVIQAVHREGGKIIAQLMHAGALVQHGMFTPIAPSAVKPVGVMLEEHGGSGESDARIIFEKLASARPTYMHTTEYKAFAPAFGEDGPTLAALAKRYGRFPVIANGKLGDPEAAERHLASGDADLVAIGTSALVNPDWVNKVKEFRPLQPFDHQFLHPIATLRDDEVV